MLSSHELNAVSDHLWQSSLFVLAAWGLTRMLRRQPARLRYGIWLAASLKFLLPFSILVSLGSSMHSFSRKIDAPIAVETQIRQVAVPFVEFGSEVLGPPQLSKAESSDRSWSWLPSALSAAWAIGSCLFAGLWGWEWVRLYRAAQRAVDVKTSGSLPLRISDAVDEPGVFGIFRPVVLMPEFIGRRLTPAQMEALLVHELQHVRRRDNFTAMLHLLVHALFWFHPMVWWIRTRLMEERELACDEAVLELRTDACTYAEGILAVCRFSCERPVWVSGVSGGDLKRRIAHIAAGASADRLSRGKAALIAVLLVSIMLTPLGAGLMQVHAASVFADSEGMQAAAITSMPKLSFEVASVKLNSLGVPPYGPPPQTNVDLDPGDIYAPTHGVLSIRNKSLRTLIAFAYKMSGDQQNYLKHHVPAFVLNERFDIEARSENKNPTKDEMRAMMRSLLEERFNMKVHNETLEANIYAMVQNSPGKFGPSMRIHPADDPACASEASAQQSPMPLADGFPAVCGVVVGMPATGKGSETKYMMKIGGRNVPMSLVAAAMVAPYTGDTGLDRNVIDKTGVAQNVDFTLELGFDEMEATFTPNTAPLFTRELSEQLGLKLKAQKGPINVYIVDHVDHLKEEQ